MESSVTYKIVNASAVGANGAEKGTRVFVGLLQQVVYSMVMTMNFFVSFVDFPLLSPITTLPSKIFLPVTLISMPPVPTKIHRYPSNHFLQCQARVVCGASLVLANSHSDVARTISSYGEMLEGY